MTRRKLTTGITLVVLVLLVGGMAVYGYKAALAPLPGASSSKKTCTGTEKQVKNFLHRGEVQVSVFNAGTRNGLASKTLDQLDRAGFKAGNAGNAPRSAEVRRALVWTTQPNDASARLVALALGPRTRVEVTETDLGPGIDVLVGNKFRGLARKAPDKIRLPRAVETCIQVD